MSQWSRRALVIALFCSSAAGAGCKANASHADAALADAALADAALADAVLADARDARTDADAASCVAPAQLDCASGSACERYVVDRLFVPAAGTPADQYGEDLDGDGKADNQLAAIMSMLSSLTQGTSPQPAVDAAIDRGELILLLTVKRDGQCQYVELVRGLAETCCNPSDPQPCASQARATCFSGSYAFAVDPALTPALLAGQVAGSSAQLRVRSAAGGVELPLYVGPDTVLRVPLQKLRLRGELDAASSAIDKGALAGAVSKQDMNDVFIPSFAAQLEAALKSPSTGGATRDFILKTFDSDSDGSVSVDEVRKSPLVQALFRLDLDLDGDKKPDHLSFAIGLHAVGARRR